MIKSLFLACISLLLISCGNINTERLSQNPIVLTSPTTFDSRQQWNEIISTLHYAKDKTIIINWSGRGGYVSVGQAVIAAMEVAKTNNNIIIIKIQDTSMSMHAIVPCSADSIEKNPVSGILAFHIISSFGVPDYSENGKQKFKALVRTCMKKHLFSNRDLKAVYNKKEVWITPRGTRLYFPDSRLEENDETD